MARRRPRRAPGRQAQGRERTREQQQREPRWLIAVLDAWAEHRATGAPLERVLQRTVGKHRLGSTERARARTLGFSLARWASAIDEVIEGSVRDFGGIKASRRDRDRAAIALAAEVAELEPVEVELGPPLSELLERARTFGAGEVLSGVARAPSWLVDKLAARFGDDVDAELEALFSRAPVTLCVAPNAQTRGDVVAALEGAEASPLSEFGVRCPGRVKPGRLRELDGVWPMDDGSQRVALATGARPGLRVLDLCAGGGGKSRLISALGAEVISADIDLKRLRACPEGRTVIADGTRPPFAPGAFDVVLVDAPCTGTGTFRRAPDRALTLNEEEVAAYSDLQVALLNAASELITPGGAVVYATCSLLLEENEHVVERAAELQVA